MSQNQVNVTYLVMFFDGIGKGLRPAKETRRAKNTFAVTQRSTRE